MTGGGRVAPGTAPTVSVVTPLYNSAPYIEQTLDSLLAQTWQDWEAILVDDGSVDDTRERVRSYLDDPRFTYVAQPNAGIAAARNTGIDVARGHWICLLDHDDRWRPHKLETQLEQARDGGWELLCSDAVVIEGDERYFYSDWFFPQQLIAGLARSEHDPSVDFLSLLLEANFVCASSAMISRRLLVEHGPLDPAAAPADDYDLWLRVVPPARMRFIRTPLVEYLFHGANYSRDYVRLHTATIYALRKNRKRHADDPRRRAEFDRALMHYYRIVVERILSEGPSLAAPRRALPVLADRRGVGVVVRRLISVLGGRLDARRRHGALGDARRF